MPFVPLQPGSEPMLYPLHHHVMAPYLTGGIDGSCLCFPTRAGARGGPLRLRRRSTTTRVSLWRPCATSSTNPSTHRTSTPTSTGCPLWWGTGTPPGHPRASRGDQGRRICWMTCSWTRMRLLMPRSVSSNKPATSGCCIVCARPALCLDCLPCFLRAWSSLLSDWNEDSVPIAQYQGNSGAWSEHFPNTSSVALSCRKLRTHITRWGWARAWTGRRPST